MHSPENWDHLRYALAVAESGSVSKAAVKLGVNHATVLRHVAAFESQVGTEVFEKSANGYRVHPDRLRVIDAAREVDAAVQAVQNVARGVAATVRGQVRVTSTDSFCQVILPPIISKWHRQSAAMSIELMSTNTHLDLSRLDADIVVRPTARLEDGLKGEQAAVLGFGVYRTETAPSDRWLGMGARLARTEAADWMAQNVAGEQIIAAADSFLALRALAVTGIGAAILPCILGDTDSRLHRVSGLLPEINVGIWVASHSDLANVARIRTVRRMLISELATISDRLAGTW